VCVCVCVCVCVRACVWVCVCVRARVCGCVGVWCGADRASRDISGIDKISLYLQFIFSFLHACLDAKGVTDKAKFCSTFLFLTKIFRYLDFVFKILCQLLLYAVS
jgi:hypothetical protein